MSLARLRCASANHAAADAADDADAAAAAAAASVTAVDEARAAMAALKTAIRDERRTVWFLPLVDVGLTRLRLAAYAADAALTRTGARAHCAADSADTFMSWSRAIQADREEWRCSLKQGKLMVMNHLFKLYYHLGNVRRCADLIRNAEGVDLNLFPKAQAVTYQYYLGSTYLFEEDYARAEECLSFAAAHCHPAHARNQQRILYLLVPLRLLLGKPVSAAALRARGMDEYSALTEAVSRGDVGAYAAWYVLDTTCLSFPSIAPGEFFMVQRVLSSHISSLLTPIRLLNVTSVHFIFIYCSASDNRVLFIAKSVYLVVEKLQMTTYRNLLRRVYVSVQPRPYTCSSSGRAPMHSLLHTYSYSAFIS
jgi:tetratricopeptide (TPR) repeat protein